MMALPRKKTTKIYEVTAHAQKVSCLDLGETGRVLVTGGQDRKVNLWAFGQNQCFMSLEGHNGGIDCVKFAVKDDYVYSSDVIGIIKRWDMNTGDQSTFHGHMKSVRTMDFHPTGDYFVSGSNDTSIQLWDVRASVSLKKYRAHISHVNSVQFSPDGVWIASAGAEGSVLIWDIRMGHPIQEFLDCTSAVNCIQFHPFEFLLAVGRVDGTVELFDLEAKKKVSSMKNSTLGTVKRCVFSENGDSLFVGTNNGISVVGWEPDTEFDFVHSGWTNLDDVKIVKNNLLCGSFESANVQVHSVNVKHLGPLARSQPFVHNQNTRRSFSRVSPGNPLLRPQRHQNREEPVPEESLSSFSYDYNEGEVTVIENGKKSLEEEAIVPNGIGNESPTEINYDLMNNKNKNFDFNPYSEDKYISTSSSSGVDLNVPDYRDFTNIVYERGNGDLEFNRNLDSSTNYRYDARAHNDFLRTVPYNYSELDFRTPNEEFPVNNANPPDYAPKMVPSTVRGMMGRQKTAIDFSSTRRSNVGHQVSTKSTKIKSSISVTNLNEFSEPLNNVNKFNKMNPAKNQANQFRHNSPIRTVNKFKNDLNLNKENNLKTQKANLKVEIYAKPPTRSKSTLDIKSACASSSNYNSMMPPPPPPQRKMNNNNHVNNHHHYESMTDNYELQKLTNDHEAVFQELCNRNATLKMVKDAAIMQDVLVAINQIVRMKDQAILVDVLGAILEKSAGWTLDMAVALLPELYELLQSDKKFHCTRACDTLRVILTNFLQLIKSNADPWAARSLGVDISSEERWKKCNECRKWLLMIRSIPENKLISTTLGQLQNLIVDI